MYRVTVQVNGVKMAIESDVEDMDFDEFMFVIVQPALSAIWSEAVVDEYFERQK